MSETDTAEVVVKDSEGADVRAGDVIHFGYGIPGVGVDARVVQRGRKLIALCPGHKPGECELTKLRKHVGNFYRMPSKEDDPKEVEAGIFANRSRRRASPNP